MSVRTVVAGLVLACVTSCTIAQVAVRARVLHTMSAPGTGRLDNAVVVITDGKVAAVGPASSTPIPEGYRVIDAPVATPGLIDARCTIGVSGLLNQRQDQDQLETSGAMQPELRAIDAFNPLDPLVAYARSLGMTTIHTGHAPGELVSGQTAVIKTTGEPVELSTLVETAAVAATIGPGAQRGGGAPGTRAKAIAMLRDELIRARERVRKAARDAEPKADATPDPDSATPAAKADERTRNLREEVMDRVVRREVPLLITCNRAQDIDAALRVAREFEIRVVLDGAAEAPLRTDEIKAAGVPVLIHPTMARAYGELENQSWETAGVLAKAGIPVAIQGGYESYVPKARMAIFEAAVAAAHGLGFEGALAAVTRDAAAILGIGDRVGSIRVGMDGDLALFDADPFEYRTKCVGVVIDGRVYDDTPR
ncbi:MAG: amidohydrolase family protein [Planctomycetota bacterium]|nr:amidohydrolase family protein [Planctomycetota bacterium]